MSLPNATSRLLLAATFALSLHGCSSAPANHSLAAAAPGPGMLRPAADEERAASEVPHRATISFENQSDDYVHVYLVEDQQRWHLGRVERGARATMRVPEQAFNGAGRVTLAVQPGTRTTSEPRVTPMLAEPLTVVLAQRWMFTQSEAGGLLTWLPLARGSSLP